jgi:RecB family exonuclease
MAFTPTVLKHAPWSVSKADSIGRCSRQYQFRYINKVKEEAKHAASRIGTATHAVLEVALANPGSDLQELADKAAKDNELVSEETRELATKLASVQDFIRRIGTFKAKHAVVREVFEHKLAITSDFKPTPFFSRDAFLRGVMDHAMITADKIMVIIDHKTGRKKPITEHSTQFFAYMLMAASNFPDIVGVQCAINYVGTDAVDWFPKSNGDHGVWTRDEIHKLRVWLEHYLNRTHNPLAVLEALGPEEAASTSTNVLCGWCGYLNRCDAGREYVEKKRAARESKTDL